jgi:hypothetical protein
VSGKRAKKVFAEALKTHEAVVSIHGATAMNLVFWLPALFVLGVVSMAACLAFAEGCARI